MSTKNYRVGLIGCGDIARKAYMPFVLEKQNAFEIVACCDIREEEAARLAADFGIPMVYPAIDDLLADPDIDIVLNLTHPAGHAPINLAALRAGKHAYSEKPFALNLEEGRAVLKESSKTGLLVGCAPDTVLGPGIQSTRALVDQGRIGRVLSGAINFASPGPEHWHPNPDFYYQKGGGPMLDMGPYYLSSLVHVLGPVKSVIGRVTRGYDERPIRSGDRDGTLMPVEAMTLYVGALEMECGAVIQSLFSFDHNYARNEVSPIVLNGTAGSILGTDPNNFDGEPRLNTNYAGDAFSEESLEAGYEWGRGLGLVDLVEAIQEKRQPRCSGEIAFHVLDVILAMEESERSGGRVEVGSSCPRPPAM